MVSRIFKRGDRLESLSAKAVVAAAVWLFAACIFAVAFSTFRLNGAKLKETETILNAAARAKSLGVKKISLRKNEDKLTAVSETVNSLGLADRVTQLDVVGSDILLKADRLREDEPGRLAFALASRGLRIAAAEIQAAQDGDARLLFIRLSVSGEAR